MTDGQGDPAERVEGDGGAGRGARLSRRRLIGVGFELLILLVAVHLLIPQLAGLAATAHQLARASWWLAVTALLLETASLLAYGQLVLVGFGRQGVAVSRSLVRRAVIVGNALAKALPGGSAASVAVVVGAYRRAGVNGLAAGIAVGGSGVLSAAALATLLPVGVLLMLTTGRLSAVVVSAAVAAAVVIGLALLAPRAARNPKALGARVETVATVLARGPLQTRVDPGQIAATVQRGAEAVRRMADDRPALARAFGWALANWLLDVAVLFFLALTIGDGTPLGAVLLAYAVAQLTALVPLTPGGIGIVEPVMIGILVSAGAPSAAASVAVLGWRLIGYWLPVMIGLALLPTVRWEDRSAAPT